MRTTLDLDEHLLKKAIELSHLHTKTAVIHASLEALIQKKRLESLISRGGRTPLHLTLRDLHRLRKDE
jgi:Arc/MetJ family transcription regulator